MSRLLVLGLSLVFRPVFFVNMEDFERVSPNNALTRSPELQQLGPETVGLIQRELPKTL